MQALPVAARIVRIVLPACFMIMLAAHADAQEPSTEASATQAPATQAPATQVPAWLKQVETWIKAEPAPSVAKPDGPAGSVPASSATPEASRARDTPPDETGAAPTPDGLLRLLEQELTGRPVAAESAPVAPPGPKPGSERFYKYTNERGKLVFTNVVEAVPVEQRAEGELDLSHVPLNSDLGAKIDARLEDEHAKLAESAYCAEQRQQAVTAPLQQVWDEYAPLLVCGAVMLLFFLVSPRMVRRVDAGAWRRVLMFAIPALAVGGLTTYSMMKTNRSISAFKREKDPCNPSALTNLTSGDNPLMAKLKLVQHLQAQVKAIEAASQSGGARRTER